MVFGALMCLLGPQIIRTGAGQVLEEPEPRGAHQVHLQCSVPGLGTLCSLLLEGDSQVASQGDFLGLFAQPKFYLSPWDWCFSLAVSGPLLCITNSKPMAQTLIYTICMYPNLHPAS